MGYKAVFLDIDGTILMPDNSYSSTTKAAIQELKEQGIRTFIATGRPLHEVIGLAEELEIDHLIGYNGALAVVEGKIILEDTFQSQLVDEFLQTASKHGHEMVLYTNGENYFTSINDPATKGFIHTFEMKMNLDMVIPRTKDILGITLFKIEKQDIGMYEKLGNLHLSRVNVPGMHHAYDVIRTNVNKGEAIQKVLDHLRIKTEEAIAFGDGMNDKEMLQSVGTSFAMANADPQVFHYATHRTTEVTDHGIYNGLKQLGLVGALKNVE